MLERPPRWNRYRAYVKEHQGLVLFIVILVLLIFLAVLILEEKSEVTGDVTGSVVREVKEANLSDGTENRIEKSSYDDVRVTSTS